MFKKVTCLALLGLLVFSINTAYAAQGSLSEEEFFDKLHELYREMVKANMDYVKAESAARKATIDKLATLGSSAKDKEMKQQILADARKNELDLRDQWLAAKASLIKQERDMRSQRAEIYEDRKASMRKSQRAGMSHVMTVNPED